MLQEFVLTRERFEFEDATKGSNRYSGFHSQGAKIVAYGLKGKKIQLGIFKVNTDF